MAGDSYPPQVRLGRLYEKTSKSSGNIYLAGRIGLARIVIVKSREPADDGTAIWDILVSQAPDKPKPVGEREETDNHITHASGRGGLT
jgi:hypothetical protein